MNAIIIKKMPVLLTLMLLLSSGHTLAQSYTTSTMRYYVYDDACDSTIVRNWKDTAVFTCSHHPSNNLYSHIFHMRRSTALPPKLVGLPATANVYGRIIDRINDMRILENECFFCGTRITPTDMEIMYDPSGAMYTEYTYDTCAFIGHYSFDNSLEVTGAIQIHLVKSVNSALRMAVYNSEYDNYVTCIELLCGCSIATHNTCLVEMSRTSTIPAAWYYHVIMPDIADEILTDVLVTDELVYTASVYANNDGEMGFRHIKRTKYPFTYPLGITTDRDLYKYDTRTYTSSHFEYGFRRLDKTPVRLYYKPNGFIVGMAGKALPNSGGGSLPLGGPYVHIFDMLSPNSMAEFQSAETGKDLNFKEMACLWQKGVVGILYSSLYNPIFSDTRTFLQFPRMGAVSVGGQYMDTLLYNGLGDLHSIDVYKEHSVSFSGIKQLGYLPLEGIQRQYNRSNSCLTLHGEKSIYRDPVLIPKYVLSGWIRVLGHVAAPIEYQPVKDLGSITVVCNQ